MKFDKGIYWCARDLDTNLTPAGNHHFLLIVGDKDMPAYPNSSINKKDNNFFFTASAGAENGGNPNNWGRLYMHINESADIKSVNEAIGGTVWHKPDYDIEYHKIEELSERDFPQLISYLKNYHVNQDSHLVRNYDITSSNCSTWMNSLMKAMGISDNKRENYGEFTGIDWGEEDLINTDYFTKNLNRERLTIDEYLMPGEFLATLGYCLKLTRRGTLELRRTSDNWMIWGRNLGKNVCFLTVDQTHGVCVKEGTPQNTGSVLWSTNTPSNKSYAIMQDDGNFVQYAGTPLNNGGFLWGSQQSRGTEPTRVKVNLSSVRFTCTFSDDEGVNNDADMDRLSLSAAPNGEGYKTVAKWSTSGEWTVEKGDYKDLSGSLDLNLYGKITSRTLYLNAYTREYDTTSSDEHGNATFSIDGKKLWDLAVLQANGFSTKQFQFDVNSDDAGFNVAFTVDVSC